MVGNELEWYAKMGYNVIKEKVRCSVSGIVESGHSFGPFGEVINSDNNVFVTIVGGGITSHEVDAPFTKGVGRNDRVKKSGGCPGFIGVELTLLTSFHGMNAIMKQGRPKVTSTDNLLSSGYTRKMAPTWWSRQSVAPFSSPW
jgi:hypothetical protein